MNKIPIKLKIVAFYTAITIIIIGFCVNLMQQTQKNKINDIVNTRMVSSMSVMEDKIITRFEDMMLNNVYKKNIAPQKLRYYERGVHYLLFDDKNNIISNSLPFDAEISSACENEIFRCEIINNEKYYIYDKKITLSNDDIFWLKGVFPAANEIYAFEISSKYNMYLAILAILFSSIGGYIILSRLLTPINKIATTAKSIAQSKDLKKRINIGNRIDEIGELANTFDEMLEKIDNAMENEKQFTSDVSHELRTPITVMLSECEFLKECEKTAPEYDESLQMIERQAKKMNTLVSELLSISRMDKQTLKLQFENTDLSELLSFICDEQEKIQNENIKLERNIQDEIYANVDRVLISRLFVNLISNAYKYNKKVGKVIVSLCEKNGKIIFSVTDTGIGISPEDLPKIWERFYQVDKSRSYAENGSCGLGLSMVKWIANTHNGTVSAKSKVGIGSTFSFEINTNF